MFAALDKLTGDAVWKTLEQCRGVVATTAAETATPPRCAPWISGRRLADALVELITGSTGTTDAACGAPHPRHQLNVIFDLNGMTDQIDRWHHSLSTAPPLPKAVLDQIRCTAGDGDVVRRAGPADLGRT
ncbi:MAG: hypothetical protein R2695_21560 [Acidimicrobiales bacterium]